MKLSEFKGGILPREESNDDNLSYPRSDLAEPPITEDEARVAGESICKYHKGLILQTGDVNGRVFFCPLGRMFWRFTTQQGGMYQPLRYGRSGIV